MSTEEVLQDHSTIKVDSPHWGVFEPDMIDESNEEVELIQYKELNVTNTVGLTRYELETRDKEAYLLPHDGYLECEYKIVQANGTPIPATDKIALQNCCLSLFKDAQYMIENQMIEEVLDPGMVYTIKNISDFSAQHQSIASNQGFYLDTQDSASLPNCNLRFFNNTGVRAGVELFVSANATPNIFVSSPAVSVSTWQNGDSVVAKLGDYSSPYDIQFRAAAALVADGLDTAQPVRTLSLDANGQVLLDYDGTNVDKDNHYVQAYVMYNGVQLDEVKFFVNRANAHVRVYLQQNGTSNNANPNARPIDYNTIANGDLLFGASRIESYNKGFTKRQARTAASKVDYVWIPLKDIFQFPRHYQKVSRGLRHRLIFNRNSDSQALMKFGNHADRTFQLTGISMWIPRLKGSLDVINKLQKPLVSGATVDVNFTDLSYWKTNVTQTAGSNKAIQLASTSKRPIRCWVAFQKASRYDGGQETNKRVFDNLKIQDIEVRLNGRKYPTMSYRFPNPTTTYEGYNRAYTMLMNSAYKMKDHDEGSLLDLETFYSLYNIFYFDLTAQEQGLFDSVKYSEVEVRWSNPGNDIPPYHVHILLENERKIVLSGLNGSLAVQL